MDKSTKLLYNFVNKQSFFRAALLSTNHTLVSKNFTLTKTAQRAAY